MADKCRRISQGAVEDVSLRACMCISCECAPMMLDRYLHLQCGTNSCCCPCLLSVSQPGCSVAVTQRYGGVSSLHAFVQQLPLDGSRVWAGVWKSKKVCKQNAFCITWISGLLHVWVQCFQPSHNCDMWIMRFIKHFYRKLKIIGCILCTIQMQMNCVKTCLQRF